MLKVLIVSKPLTPPWTDASKNLARDVVLNCPDFRFRVFTEIGDNFKSANVRSEDLYTPDLDEFIPWSKFKLFFRLLKPDEMGLYHFFFAPNPNTSKMIKLAMSKKGYQRSVQTVCSQPASFDGIKNLLFSEAVVSCSHDCRKKLLEAGVENVRCIHPAVPDVELPDEAAVKEIRRRYELPENAVLALYSGDLEFSGATDILLKALPFAFERKELHLVICHRDKTPQTKKLHGKLVKSIEAAGWKDRVHFVEPQPDLNPLLSAVNFLIMAPDSLYGKMDLPLVILEGMSYGRPAILSDLPSLLEIPDGEEAALTVKVGDAKALGEAMSALAEDKALLKQLGERAKLIVQDRFSTLRLGNDYSNLYREFE